MADNKKYILFDGTEVEAIPKGKSSVVIGEISPNQQFIVCDRIPS